MPQHSPLRLPSLPVRRAALRIALIYAVVALVWIFASDRLLLLLSMQPETLAELQTWKGSLFVLVTALLLYLLVKRALDRQRQGKELLRKVIESMPLGVYLADAEGNIILGNRAGQEIWAGCRYVGVEGYGTYRGWWADSGRPIAAEEWGMARAIRSGENVLNEEIEIECFDGNRKTILHSAVPLAGEDGRRLGGLVVIQDISERKAAEVALQKSEQKFAAFMEFFPGFAFIKDRRRRHLQVNPQLAELLGAADGSWRDRTFEELLPGEAAELVRLHDEQVLSRDEPETFEETAGQNGEERTYLSIKFPIPQAGAEPLLGGISLDISQRKAYERQLEHQANYDFLTGLANRSLLTDRLRQSLIYADRSGRIVAVLMLDIDRFKVINESLGHRQGDELLKQIAARLADNLRAGDTLAHPGGDEFVVTLAEVAEIDDVGLVANKLRELLGRPFTVAGRELRVTASIGISLYPKDGADAENLLRHADIAMYRAKEEGGDSVRFFAADMNLRAHETLELEADLRRALERGEFLLHYQPKVVLADGRLSGCEALVRWQHPQRGLVPPGAFIPLAEETGLIVPLGAWVLRRACAQAREWQDAGLPPCKVAVNLSARQFAEPDLVERIEAILAETGLEPTWLELELTESMLMRDPLGAAATMRRLRELGIGLCLDDFGTGFSSLNYLRRFPVDYLKIDRSFIVDVTSDASAAAVASSVVAIAHSLGIVAVAEGVETREQLEFLAGCRCDQLQGYLFSRPLPAADFAALVREGRRLEPPRPASADGER